MRTYFRTSAGWFGIVLIQVSPGLLFIKVTHFRRGRENSEVLEGCVVNFEIDPTKLLDKDKLVGLPHCFGRTMTIELLIAELTRLRDALQVES